MVVRSIPDRAAGLLLGERLVSGNDPQQPQQRRREAKARKRSGRLLAEAPAILVEKIANPQAGLGRRRLGGGQGQGRKAARFDHAR